MRMSDASNATQYRRFIFRSNATNNAITGITADGFKL